MKLTHSSATKATRKANPVATACNHAGADPEGLKTVSGWAISFCTPHDMPQNRALGHGSGRDQVRLENPPKLL